MDKIDAPDLKFLRPFYRLMSRLGQYEWRILVALLLIVGGVWLTINLAEEVSEGDTHTIDQALLLAAAAYLTLGSLMAQIQPRFRPKAFTILLAIFVMVLVGLPGCALAVRRVGRLDDWRGVGLALLAGFPLAAPRRI